MGKKEKEEKTAGKIIWRTVQRRVSDLTPFDRNPRTVTDKALEKLQKSLDKFGYVETISINTDNMIIGGHQRHTVLLKEDPNQMVDVRLPDRSLSDADFEELNAILNLSSGKFNFDQLKQNVKIDNLLEMGFERWQLGLQNSMISMPVIAQGDSNESHEKTPEQHQSTHTETQTEKQQPGESQSHEAPDKQDPDVLYEIYIKKSVRQKLYDVLNRIKTEKGIATTPEAFDYFVSNFNL